MTTWSAVCVAFLLLAGTGVQLAVDYVARACRRRARVPLIHGIWVLALAGALASTAIIVGGPTSWIVGALNVRTFMIAIGIVLVLPAVFAAGGVALPRVLIGIVITIVGVRLVAWFASDTIFRHRIDADGLPVYGDQIGIFAIPLSILLLLGLLQAAVRWQSSPGRASFVISIVATVALAVWSIFTGDVRLGETLTGSMLIPVLVAMEIHNQRAERRKERERRRLEVEHREMNRRLQEALRVREEILAAASHELRTPLTPIVGLSEMLEQRYGALSDSQRLDHVRTIRRNAGRLEHRVSDLLSASRLRAVGVTRTTCDVAVREVLDEVAGTFAGDLAVRCDPDLIACADRAHLRQVLANLAGNALRYGRPAFTLSADLDGDWTEIRVSDEGPGVPVEFVGELFEPFSQASRGDRRTSSGMGLGLSIAQLLVRADGGEIAYEPGRPTGACFVVRLPRSTVATRA